MQYGVEPVDVGVSYIADILVDCRDGVGDIVLAKGRRLVEIRVQADDVVSRLEKHGHEHRTHIAIMTSH